MNGHILVSLQLKVSVEMVVDEECRAVFQIKFCLKLVRLQRPFHCSHEQPR